MKFIRLQSVGEASPGASFRRLSVKLILSVYSLLRPFNYTCNPYALRNEGEVLQGARFRLLFNKTFSSACLYIDY